MLLRGGVMFILSIFRWVILGGSFAVMRGRSRLLGVVHCVYAVGLRWEVGLGEVGTILLSGKVSRA